MSSAIDKCWHDRMLAAGWRPVGGVTGWDDARRAWHRACANPPDDREYAVLCNKDAPGQCVVARREGP